jgi:Uma2 family endonuclease
MATKAIMAVSEYLRTSWPDGDREYVHGEIVEKPMPPFSHGEIQILLGALFLRLSSQSGAPRFIPVSEVRHRLAPDVFRLPDLAVFLDARPKAEVPDTPPFIAIEILSPDDRMTVLLEKLREYRDWGVAHVWVVDPEGRRMYEFNSDGLRETGALLLPEYQITIPPADLFPQP